MLEPIPFAGWVNTAPPHIVDSGASLMNNEPVAIRYDFDGYGYQYMDSGSGSDWLTRVNGDPLYTHPAKTLTDDEIAKVAKEFFLSEYVPYEFVRAILKKAQEK
jgi:hypothetical protein